MTLKHGMWHQGLKLYKFYINDDPGLTLTYYTAMSNSVAYMFEWGKLLQSHLMGETLLQRTILTEKYWELKTLTPGDREPLPPGYIHVYDQYFQTSSLKPLDQSMQILC